ncbi:MAG TPA: hypothetical protein VE523_00015 [Solirubrobacterales bacterium]|jgi:hypothetical protein|nr:hypothetical protein [Solirubrobacterales bacterium]
MPVVEGGEAEAAETPPGQRGRRMATVVSPSVTVVTRHDEEM